VKSAGSYKHFQHSFLLITYWYFVVVIDEESSKCGYDIESKLSADSGFFDCQAVGILSAELDTDKQQLIAFDKSLQTEINHGSSKLPTCGELI
jgi:hypothetical protein